MGWHEVNQGTRNIVQESVCTTVQWRDALNQLIMAGMLPPKIWWWGVVENPSKHSANLDESIKLWLLVFGKWWMWRCVLELATWHLWLGLPDNRHLRKAETFQKMKSYSCLLHLLFPSDKCIYTHYFETIRCALRYETPLRETLGVGSVRAGSRLFAEVPNPRWMRIARDISENWYLAVVF